MTSVWIQKLLINEYCYMQKVKKTGQCLMAGAQPEIFQGRGGFMKLGHFDKQFFKKSRKKGPAGKNFGVFFS